MTPRTLVGGVALLLLATSPFTVNSLLQGAAALVLGLFAVLLVRPQVMPVVPLALGYQWLQVSVGVFYANFLGVPLAEVLVDGDTTRATAIGLAAVAIATLVVALLLQRYGRLDVAALGASLRKLDLRTTLFAYGALFVVTVPLVTAFGVSGQFAQVFQGFEAVRWSVFLLLFAGTLVQQRGAVALLVVLAAELAVGFSGYFAGFAAPLLFALLAFLAVFPLLTRPQRASAYGIAAALFAVSLVWTAVKGDYRKEVSDQGRSQVVNVSLGERYSILGRMASDSVAGRLDGALDRFVRRFAYVEYFGIVLERVPTISPHTEGALAEAALRHIFMPRVLFPDKAPLPSDSELTAYYTGNNYLLYMTGTSISLGYVAESYIDFGLPGVAGMAVVLAGLMGLVVIVFKRAARDPGLFVAFSCSTLMGVRLFETSLPKLLGGTLSVFLVQWALLVVARAPILAFLRGERRVRRPLGGRR